MCKISRPEVNYYNSRFVDINVKGKIYIPYVLYFQDSFYNFIFSHARTHFSFHHILNRMHCEVFKSNYRALLLHDSI